MYDILAGIMRQLETNTLGVVETARVWGFRS